MRVVTVAPPSDVGYFLARDRRCNGTCSWTLDCLLVCGMLCSPVASDSSRVCVIDRGHRSTSSWVVSLRGHRKSIDALALRPEVQRSLPNDFDTTDRRLTPSITFGWVPRPEVQSIVSRLRRGCAVHGLALVCRGRVGWQMNREASWVPDRRFCPCPKSRMARSQASDYIGCDGDGRSRR
jgi:hypothetical protein